MWICVLEGSSLKDFPVIVFLQSFFYGWFSLWVFLLWMCLNMMIVSCVIMCIEWFGKRNCGWDALMNVDWNAIDRFSYRNEHYLDHFGLQSIIFPTSREKLSLPAGCLYCIDGTDWGLSINRLPLTEELWLWTLFPTKQCLFFGWWFVISFNTLLSVTLC